MKERFIDTQQVYCAVVVTAGVRMNIRMWNEVQKIVKTAIEAGPKDIAAACKVDVCLSVTEDKDR